EEKDWAIISLFNEVLQHFEHVLITLEGDGQQRKRKEGYIGAYGCPWDTLLGYEYLLGKMEVYKAAAHRYPDPEHFKVNINLCWKKLDKYYSRLDETPVYYAAIALHPAYRWGYFEDVWADRLDWIQTAKSLVEELYRSHYEPRIISRDRERGEPVTKKRRIYRNPFDEYREESRQAPTLLQPPSSMTTLLQAEDAASSSTNAVGDEYSDWFRDVHKSDQNILDPISYWYERREEYPRLSQMALDVLSVLPMSADVERLFSTCGRMVRDDRARLDASTIGMTQTVRSWHCGGYIKSTEKLLEDVKVPGTDLSTFLGSYIKHGEDMELAYRILNDGWKTVYQSNAVVHTMAPETLKKAFFMFSRWERTMYTFLCLGYPALTARKAWKLWSTFRRPHSPSLPDILDKEKQDAETLIT
ncbi:hypothetical protein BFJ63_vAg19168, partial [Fusarium oxysporum f. sp. narcissi]